MALLSRIGIVGAGQMGTGIALTAARASLAVRLVDSSSAQITKSAAFIKKWVEKETKKNAEFGQIESRIQLQSDFGALADCDAVIECISENISAKNSLLKSLGSFVKPEAIVASNTSSYSITELARAFVTPEKFVGMHFFNPVPVMQLVEVVPGLRTAPETLEKAKTLATSLGKEIIVAKDRPLFVVNRILICVLNEAVHILAEGVGSVADIDKTAKLGLGHPMGPFELADFVGLDTCLEVMKSLHRRFGDPKYRPDPLLSRYVEAGWLGRKTGRGFYVYSS